jgi:hypothetical protein
VFSACREPPGRTTATDEDVLAELILSGWNVLRAAAIIAASGDLWSEPRDDTQLTAAAVAACLPVGMANENLVVDDAWAAVEASFWPLQRQPPGDKRVPLRWADLVNHALTDPEATWLDPGLAIGLDDTWTDGWWARYSQRLFKNVNTCQAPLHFV